MIKLVFADIDNTLLDFDEFIRFAMETGFRKFCLGNYEPRMYTVFTEENGNLWKRLELGDLTFDYIEKNRWNIVFRRLGIEFDGTVFEAFFRKTLWDCAIPISGAHEMLRELKEHFIVCAASNGPYMQQMHRLDISDMSKYFDYCFISEKVGSSKPDTAFFDYAFDTINKGRSDPIHPDECVIIGDSVSSDMESGFRYGMKTFYFNKSGSAIPDNVTWSSDNLAYIAKMLIRESGK